MMKDCPTCGKPVWLRATNVTVNRRAGVAHWLEHQDGTPMHERGWDTLMLKPYPKAKADRASQQMIARWNDDTDEKPLVVNPS